MIKKIITICIFTILLMTPCIVTFAQGESTQPVVFNPLADNDGDGVTNEQELLDGTDIDDSQSVLESSKTSEAKGFSAMSFAAPMMFMSTQTMTEDDSKKADIIFVVDQSKAMQTKDSLNMRLATVRKFIELLNDPTYADKLRFGVVDFTEYGELTCDLTNDYTLLSNALDSMVTLANGVSNIADGLWVAANSFEFYSAGASESGNAKHKKNIILLTDGVDTSGNTMEMLTHNITQLNKRWTDITEQAYNKITIDTVDLSTKGGVQTLKNIAEAGDGSYLPVYTPGDVQAEFIYRKISSQILTSLDAQLPDSDTAMASTAMQFPEKYAGLDYDDAKRLYGKTHVNLLTGNYINQVTDMKIEGPVMSLSFTRTYNSDLGYQKTALGYGWRTNFDTEVKDIDSENTARVTARVLNLRESPYGKIIGTLKQDTEVYYLGEAVLNGGLNWRPVLTSDGRWGYAAVNYLSSDVGVEVTYDSGTKKIFLYDREDPDGTVWYTSPAETYDTLKKQNGYYYLTKKEGVIYAYEGTGKLLHITDQYSNGMHMTYNSDGKITEAEDGVARAITFQYNDIGLLSRITSPLGTYVEYSYDADGNLASVKDMNGQTTTYSYNSKYKDDGQLESSKLTRVVDANGNQTVKNDYDPYGRIVRQYDGNSFVKYHIYKDVYMNEGDGTIIAGQELARYFIDENGYVYKTTFDVNTGKIISESDPAGASTQHTYIDNSDEGHTEEITNPLGNKTAYQYDGKGNLIKLTDHFGCFISMEYNDKNNLTRKVDKKGIVTTYSYYDGGQLLDTVTHPLGNTIKHEYHGVAQGTVLSGLLKKTTESVGGEVFKTTEYKYENGYNNRTEVIDSLGNSTKEYYDTIGRLVKVTAPNQSDTVFTYDNMGRFLSETDGLGYSFTYTYDNAGNRILSTDKRGYITAYEYDAENQLVAIKDPSGNTSRIVYDAKGNKISETNVNTSTTKYEYDYKDNLVAVVDPLLNKTTYKFDAVDNMISVTDARGNETTYEYDALGKKTKETALLGKVTTYQYDANDNLISVTDAKGKVTHYEYDVLNRKTAVIDGYDSAYSKGSDGLYTGPKDENGDYTGNIETTFIYSLNGDRMTVTTRDPLFRQSIKEYNALSKLVREADADPRHNERTYEYDSVGNLITLTESGNTVQYQYDLLGRLISSTDQLSQTERFEYDASGNNTVKIDKRGYRWESTYDYAGRVLEVTDTQKNIKKYSYDAVGNKNSETDECGNVTYFYYDLSNRLMGERDAQGYAKYYEYDAVGNKIYETDREEHSSSESYVKAVTTETGGTVYKLKIKYLYDFLNRLEEVRNQRGLRVLYYTYDAVGNSVSTCDGEDGITLNGYDKLNRKVSTSRFGDSSILENTITYRYDAAGNLIMQADSSGAVDNYTYDEMNRQISNIRRDLGNTISITTQTTYNANGDKASDVDGNGVTATYSYDSLHRLVASTRDGKTINYEYDGNNNTIAETDWRGNRHEVVFDDAGRLIAKKNANGDIIEATTYYSNGWLFKSSDAQGNVTEYYYDKNGNVTRVVDPEGNIIEKTYTADGMIKTEKDGRGNITTYNYNETGKLSSVVNAKGETTSYTYDLNGNLLTQTDGSGNIVAYMYNPANKPYQKIYRGRAGTSDASEIYTYYANGNLATVTDRNGVATEYTYDIYGRLINKKAGDLQISYTYDNNGNQLTVTDSTGTTVRTYDSQNRVLTKNTPGVGTTYFSYDILDGVQTGFVKEVTTDPKGNTTEKDYDKEDRLVAVSTESGATQYSYYPNGARKTVRYSNGAYEEYAYYKNNLLRTLVNYVSDSNILETFNYAYDAAGNQTVKVDSKGTTTYAYDELNRLSQVTEPGGKTTRYTYDASGNRTQELIYQGQDIASVTCIYGAHNRLTGVIRKQNNATQEVQSIAYDKNGNQISTTVVPYVDGVAQAQSIVEQNAYDTFNRLVWTLKSGKVLVNYYNGEDLRVAKSVNGTLTRMAYDAGQIILEVDADGNQ